MVSLSILFTLLELADHDIMIRLCHFMNQQVLHQTNVARGRIAMLSCHPSQRRMHWSAACDGRAQSPAGSPNPVILRYITVRRHMPPPSKVPFPRGSGPHLLCVSLDPHESVPQTALRSVQTFLHSSYTYILYLSQSEYT